MARGKHKARSTNRQIKANQETVATLTEQLEQERVGLASALVVCDQVDELQTVLQDGTNELTADTEPQLAQLIEKRNALRYVFRKTNAIYQGTHQEWQRYMKKCVDMSPGNTSLEQLEYFSKVVGIRGFLAEDVSGTKQSFSVDQLTQLQRARGERTNVSHSTKADVELSHVQAAIELGFLRLDHYEQLDAVGLWPEDSDLPVLPETNAELTAVQRKKVAAVAKTVTKVEHSNANTLNADAIHLWGSSMFSYHDQEVGPSLTALGLCEDKSLETEPEDDSVQQIVEPGHEHSEALTPDEFIASKRRTLDNWDVATRALGTQVTCISPVPVHSKPDRGIALQSAYTRAGLSQWMHAGPEPHAYSASTVRLAAASTYWLPAGQTKAFADSEPLDDQGRAELSLPFQEVLLAFAEPLILPATGQPDPETRVRMRNVSSVAQRTLTMDLNAYSVIDHMLSAYVESICLEQMLSLFGARIEGLLLLADEDGTPADRFAWCVTVPGEYGASLGRFVIPAKRSMTDYRDLVDNLTAVVAWGHWHDPDVDTAVDEEMTPKQLRERVKSSDFLNNATDSGVNIRVINVRRTTKRTGAGSPSGVSSHSAATAHVRRGHWRRQRYGTGMEQVKRIRIAPVLVNAHRKDVTLSVYRLPAAKKLALVS